MTGAARQLAAALERTATSLEINDTLDPEELTHGIKEMPMFEIAGLQVSLKMTALGLFGRSAAVRRIEARLRKQIGQDFSSALSAYSDLLESWTKRVLGEIKRRFSAHADAYRAQLERLAGQSDANDNDDALRRDRDLLDKWEDTLETANDDNRRLTVEIG